MQPCLTHKEAVRLAKEKLGESNSGEMAAYIQEHFGLIIKPPIVTVLLGSLQERQSLDHSGQKVYARIEEWKAENPEEAKKLAAVTRRREAARRRKAEQAPVQQAPVQQAPVQQAPAQPQVQFPGAACPIPSIPGPEVISSPDCVK